MCLEGIGLSLVLFITSAIKLNLCSVLGAAERMCSLLQTSRLNSYWFFFFLLLPTEAASRAIVQFLEVNQSEEASRGWMLLTTINLLASSGQVSLKQQS